MICDLADASFLTCSLRDQPKPSCDETELRDMIIFLQWLQATLFDALFDHLVNNRFECIRIAQPDALHTPPGQSPAGDEASDKHRKKSENDYHHFLHRKPENQRTR